MFIDCYVVKRDSDRWKDCPEIYVHFSECNNVVIISTTWFFECASLKLLWFVTVQCVLASIQSESETRNLAITNRQRWAVVNYFLVVQLKSNYWTVNY